MGRWYAYLLVILTWSIAADVSSDSSVDDFLNASIVLFEPGIPADASSHRELGIFPQIREVEAKILPYVLRQHLIQSDHWGAVRVLPKKTIGQEILIEGTIIHSDGATLAIQITVTDALNNVWIDKLYRATSISESESLNKNGIDPVISLFDEVALDLWRQLKALDQRAIQNIRHVALLRYSEYLAPKYFSGYLATNPLGGIEILRLPAEQDPTLARIRKIQNLEFTFIDTVDEQYRLLYEEISPTYDLWRKYRGQLKRYKSSEQVRRQNQTSNSRRGSYSAIRQSYENYKWIKVEEQNLKRWAAGFSNEVAPTVLNVDGRVVQLNGSLETRHQEWQSILSQLFTAETGFATSPTITP